MSVDQKLVSHVSKLCKIDIEDNLEKYYQEFAIIMESVDQIVGVEVNKDILITPNQNKNLFFKKPQLNEDIKDFFKKDEQGYLVVKRSGR